MLNTIILCADDYAQNATISRGILHLIQQRRLSATSCLVTSPHWQEHAQWLRPYAAQVDIGLHFNLTWRAPLGAMPRLCPHRLFPSLQQLLLQAHTGQIDIIEIKQELNRQLDQFVMALGKLPDFIDGHQHVQLLPIIRTAVLDYYQKHFPQHKTWLRSVNPAGLTSVWQRPAFNKKLILYAVGGKCFEQLLRKNTIAHNPSFAGIYNFATHKPYAKLFELFLNSITSRGTSRGLIMCHPGLPSEDRDDPIFRTRSAEYTYFLSSAFDTALARRQVQLGRFYSAASA